MNSISNDHPSAYYRCDYKPFVCFIVALNLRGFNECWDIKPSPPRMGRSQGLFDVALRVLCFFFLLIPLYCLWVCSHHALNYCQNYSWPVQGWQCKLGFVKPEETKTWMDIVFRCGSFGDDEGFWVKWFSCWKKNKWLGQRKRWSYRNRLPEMAKWVVLLWLSRVYLCNCSHYSTIMTCIVIMYDCISLPFPLHLSLQSQWASLSIIKKWQALLRLLQPPDEMHAHIHKHAQRYAYEYELYQRNGRRSGRPSYLTIFH